MAEESAVVDICPWWSRSPNTHSARMAVLWKGPSVFLLFRLHVETAHSLMVLVEKFGGFADMMTDMSFNCWPIKVRAFRALSNFVME